MIEAIERLKSDGVALINDAKTLNDVNNVKVKIFGKNGDFTIAMRGLKDVPREQKPEVGKMFNDVKVMLEGRIAEKEAEFKEIEKQARIKSEYIDVTLPGKTELGALHPLTEVKNQILDTFIGLGFEVKEGPEIESDYFNFQLLNIPKDHPARDMQDTFYVNDKVVLRTHTSPCEARALMTVKPPFRLVIPGRVFRVDEVDASHSPVFMQMEGLVVDKNISFADLKGTLDEFVHTVFGPDVKTRMRPSYFPFTEPSAEVDISCTICGGKGCRVCKGTGWLEILGCGVTNPHELENCGLDPHEWSAFAFGIGVDRVTSLKYGINDIRLEYENDARFLGQF